MAEKVLKFYIGHVRDAGVLRVEATIDEAENNVGFTGNIGVFIPGKGVSSKGESGQIILSFKEYDDRGYLTLEDVFPQTPWTAEKVCRLFELWDRWHLNDLKAGCVHQREQEWNKRRIDPSKPLTDYGLHHPNQKQATCNMLCWVSPDEVPGGLLTAPCPICGYKYGTSWLKEEVPREVFDEIKAFPRTKL